MDFHVTILEFFIKWETSQEFQILFKNYSFSHININPKIKEDILKNDLIVTAIKKKISQVPTNAVLGKSLPFISFN